MNAPVAALRPHDTPAPAHDLQQALTAIEKHDPVVMISGRAGTGKTTFIRNLLRDTETKQVVVAPTGVAALNVGGQTIHSFFRIPPRMVNLAEIQPRKGGGALFKKLQRVIIDEISMVRADLLDAVDYALRINRKNNKPFGGVQMVLVGDYLQLPPVVRGEEQEMLQQRGYETPYAFSAKCLQALPVTAIEFTTVHRQHDPDFIALLGSIRMKEDVAGAIEKLNKACCGPHKREATPIILTGTNAAADAHNKAGLAALSGNPISYTSELKGDFNVAQDKLPAPELLELKKGARVMMVKNDPAKRWVNGSLATVTKLSKEAIWVKLDGKAMEHEVEKTSWENIRYAWNEETQQIAATTIGSFSQFPLTPAWAITIHKAQGLTLENVRIDLQGGAFSAGQTYVALSRATSLEGLSLAHPLKASDIRVDRLLLEFAQQKT